MGRDYHAFSRLHRTHNKMTSPFDYKALATSIGKMLATANSTVDSPGASIVTQRLIDYSSGEFGKLTPRQVTEVLAVMDKKYESNLLRDGNGNVIGYVYSGKIFVSLKDNQQKAPPWQQAEPDAAKDEKSLRTGPRGQRRRNTRQLPSSNPEKSAGKSMTQKASKKSAQGGGGQEDYAAKYAAQYMGKQDETKDSKKKSKKKDDAGGQGGQEDYAAKYAAQYMGQQGGNEEKKDKKKSKKKDDKKSDKKKAAKKADKKSEKKADKKKSDKKKK